MLLKKNPKFMLQIGMATLVMALVGPRVLHPDGVIGPDLLDGLQWMLIGMSVAANLAYVYTSRRRSVR